MEYNITDYNILRPRWGGGGAPPPPPPGGAVGVCVCVSVCVSVCAAFLATATSAIMPISSFGIFAATVVLANYSIVITLYPCAVVRGLTFQGYQNQHLPQPTVAP
jgi:hypothetical protein